MLIKANANYSIVDSKAELKSLVGNEVISLTEYYIRQINTLYLIDLSDESFVTPFEEPPVPTAQRTEYRESTDKIH